MISEEKQEQAVLYSLGLLDADEAGAFEREMKMDADLASFARECYEASAALALEDYRSSSDEATAGFKQQVMQTLPITERGDPHLQTGMGRIGANVIRFPRFAGVPWAVAALLMLFCGLLVWRQTRLQQEKFSLMTSLDQAQSVPVKQRDLLGGVSVCQLESPGISPATQPRAAVVWDAARREGVLQIVRLKPPAVGKDYELWTVEDGRKEPISAGLVHLDAQGQATTAFKPSKAEGRRVLAFALSLEKAGGSPVNAGPIVLVGNL